MARKKPTTAVEAPEETTDVAPAVPASPDADGPADSDTPVGDVPPAASPVEPGEPQQEQVSQADAAPFEPGQNHERAKLIAFR